MWFVLLGLEVYTCHPLTSWFRIAGTSWFAAAAIVLEWSAFTLVVVPIARRLVRDACEKTICRRTRTSAM